MRIFTALALVVVGAASSYIVGQHGETKPAATAQIQVAKTMPAATGMVVAEGKIAAYPGAEVLVASEDSGIISDIRVHELDVVRKGQVIADLRKSDLLAAQEEARAKIHEVEADIRLADAENHRTGDLVRRQFVSRQAMDKTERDLFAAQARLASAQAALRRISAQIEKTRIVAPIGATVVIRHVHEGEAVAGGGSVVTLADLSRMRVEAEVDEFDIGRINPGDAVTITAEGFDGKLWRGKVEEMPDAVRERGLRPQDVARPSDARILLVKVALLEPVPLKLGQRVEVTIGTGLSGLAHSASEKTTKKAM